MRRTENKLKLWVFKDGMHLRLQKTFILSKKMDEVERKKNKIMDRRLKEEPPDEGFNVRNIEDC